MSLQTRLVALAEAIGTDIKALEEAVASSGGGGSPLAYHEYKPSSIAAYSLTSVLDVPAPWVTIDSTNLKVTFDSPASGEVFVSYNLPKYQGVSASYTRAFAALDDGSGLVDSSVLELPKGANHTPLLVRQKLSLAPSTQVTLTLKWLLGSLYNTTQYLYVGSGDPMSGFTYTNMNYADPPPGYFWIMVKEA